MWYQVALRAYVSLQVQTDEAGPHQAATGELRPTDVPQQKGHSWAEQKL
jgi:hypothetical protein